MNMLDALDRAVEGYRVRPCGSFHWNKKSGYIIATRIDDDVPYGFFHIVFFPNEYNCTGMFSPSIPQTRTKWETCGSRTKRDIVEAKRAYDRDWYCGLPRTALGQ